MCMPNAALTDGQLINNMLCCTVYVADTQTQALTQRKWPNVKHALLTVADEPVKNASCDFC